MLSRGSKTRPRAAQRGLSLNHPPQPAVPSPFYVNHLHTKKPLECTGLSHVAQQTLVSTGRLFSLKKKQLITRNQQNSHRLSSSVCCQYFLKPIQCCCNTSIYLRANKQTLAVKGTFDRRCHKSKVAGCQTPETSSKEYLVEAAATARLIIPGNQCTEGTQTIKVCSELEIKNLHESS